MSNFTKQLNIPSYRSNDSAENDSMEKINKTTKNLEILLKKREIQKMRMQTFNNNKHNLSSSSCYDHPIVFCCKNESKSAQKNCYSYIWDAYWPFIGSKPNPDPDTDPNTDPDTDPQLDVELNYITFNGTVIQKWKTDLPTPPISFFPIKDLFQLTLETNGCLFDFNLKLENIPNNCDATVININQQSKYYPFNLNQYILIKDPGIIIDDNLPITTSVQAVISFYQSTELYLNQFTKAFDSLTMIKNLFFSTQLFVMHINQIKSQVKLSVSHNTTIGENLFKVNIETCAKVEIKEVIIPIVINSLADNDNDNEPAIVQKTVYIDGAYFMTYITYINNVLTASKFGSVPLHTPNAYQIPLQLATMIFFGPTVPIISLDNVVPITDHERMLIRLYKEILQGNV